MTDAILTTILAVGAASAVRALADYLGKKNRVEVAQLIKRDEATDILVGIAPPSTTDVSAFGSDSSATTIERSRILQRAQESVDDSFYAALSGVQPSRNEVRMPGVTAVEEDLQRARQNSFSSSGLTNTVRIRATPSMIKKLYAKNDVVFIVENRSVGIPEPVRLTQTNFEKLQQVEQMDGRTWGLQAIDIDKVWDEGLTGAGVRVGHLDSGVEADHPHLSGRVSDFALFDPLGRRVPGCAPFDSGDHGTHTAGTIVGGDSKNLAIGVAPDATLVSAAVLLGGQGTLWQILKGLEWTVDMGCDVVNLSLGMEGYEGSYAFTLSRLRAVGVIPVCSIGNRGLAMTGSPGNLATAFGVGAIDYDGHVSTFSGGGSLTIFDDGGSSIVIDKPDIVAPGEAILSAMPGEGLQYLSGTSMAAPHVTGIIAVLLQAKPDASAEEILTALRESAIHPFAKGNAVARDSRFGRGRVDPLGALRRLIA